MDASADLAPTELVLLQNGYPHGTHILTRHMQGMRGMRGIRAASRIGSLDGEGAA